MKHELRRVEPLRAANVMALVYGLLMGVLAVIFIPFFLLVLLVAPPADPGPGGPLVVIFLLVFYPVIGLVMGWITGLLGAAIYNLIVRWTGGLLLEVAGPILPTDIQRGMV